MKVSIITVNYNDANGLLATIESVRCQDYGNIEFVIVDGDSSDSSLSVIKNNALIVSDYISEKDTGIYHAMNKGIRLINGDYVIFMNSGDVFYSKSVLSDFVNKITNTKIVYFGRAEIYISRDKKWFYPNYKFSKKNIANWLNKSLPNHQAMFFPKSFYKHQYYSLDYPISSDADYKFRSINSCGIEFLDLNICRFKVGGASSSFSSFKKTKQIIIECWHIHKQYEGIEKALRRVFFIFLKYSLSKLDLSFFNLILNKYRN